MFCLLPFANAFAKSAQMLGASIFEYTPVIEIEKKDNGFLIQTTTGQCRSQVCCRRKWGLEYLPFLSSLD